MNNKDSLYNLHLQYELDLCASFLLPPSACVQIIIVHMYFILFISLH